MRRRKPKIRLTERVHRFAEKVRRAARLLSPRRRWAHGEASMANEEMEKWFSSRELRPPT